jgi:hypothetical protein
MLTLCVSGGSEAVSTIPGPKRRGCDAESPSDGCHGQGFVLCRGLVRGHGHGARVGYDPHHCHLKETPRKGALGERLRKVTLAMRAKGLEQPMQRL